VAKHRYWEVSCPLNKEYLGAQIWKSSQFHCDANPSQTPRSRSKGNSVTETASPRSTLEPMAPQAGNASVKRRMSNRDWFAGHNPPREFVHKIWPSPICHLSGSTSHYFIVLLHSVHSKILMLTITRLFLPPRWTKTTISRAIEARQ
jgi:hypothetical protein